MKKMIIYCSLIILALSSVIAYTAEIENVKIAVASDNKTETSSVSSQAARCNYFLIFDGKGNLIETVDNPYKDAPRGAGTSAANFLAQKGATLVVAETFGTKMINAMEDKGIEHYEFKGKVEDAVNRILKKEQSL
jgi:predicted Fe-Mo cluster-binding NifX family protein